MQEYIDCSILRWGVDGDEGLFITTFVTDDDGMGMKLPYKEAGPRHLGPTERCHPPSSRQKKASQADSYSCCRAHPSVARGAAPTAGPRGGRPTPHIGTVWAARGPPRPGSGSGDVIGKRPCNLRAAGPGQR